MTEIDVYATLVEKVAAGEMEVIEAIADPAASGEMTIHVRVRPTGFGIAKFAAEIEAELAHGGRPMTLRECMEAECNADSGGAGNG